MGAAGGENLEWGVAPSTALEDSIYPPCPMRDGVANDSHTNDSHTRAERFAQLRVCWICSSHPVIEEGAGLQAALWEQGEPWLQDPPLSGAHERAPSCSASPESKRPNKRGLEANTAWETFRTDSG